MNSGPDTMIQSWPVGEPGQAPDGGTRILEIQPLALAVLMITSGPRAGTPLTLTRGQTKIGRGSGNDHIIDDDAVSTDHLSIRYRDGQFVLRDLDAANPTKVNGQEMPERDLQDKDVIRIGETELVFRTIEPAGVLHGN